MSRQALVDYGNFEQVIADEMTAGLILHGITLLRTGSSYVEADQIILNPADWEIVLKYAATTGELVVSPTPTSAQPMQLWGVPVTVTSQLSAGVGLVANLAQNSVVFSRESTQLFVDPYGLATSNMVRGLIGVNGFAVEQRPYLLLRRTSTGPTVLEE